MDVDFESFVMSRKARLLRVAYLLCGDHGHAEDMVQTTLVKLHVAWPRLRRRDELDAYVRRALMNEATSRWRRATSRREVSVAEVPETTLHQQLPNAERDDALWRALQLLPQRQRAVLVLRYYEDLTEAEIADALGIAPGTVKSQASKGLSKLREQARLDPVLREEQR